MANLALGRVLREHVAPVHAIDFSNDGEVMLTAAEDDRVCLYDCQKGILKVASQCTSLGIGLARFTHDPVSLLVTAREAALKQRNGLISANAGEIRYLSLHDNRYLQAFRGHNDAVCSLEVSPKEDIFASASTDRTARIWDLRSDDCQGELQFDEGASRPALSFDPHGLLLAAGLPGNVVKLFDLRKLSKGPFVKFELEFEDNLDFASIKFSFDGKLMLLGTAQGCAIALDAFTGEIFKTYRGHTNSQQLPLAACFTQDAETVLSGSEDGSVWRWSTQTGEPLPVLTAHAGPVRVVQCNPTRKLVASACSVTCLWIDDA